MDGSDLILARATVRRIARGRRGSLLFFALPTWLLGCSDEASGPPKAKTPPPAEIAPGPTLALGAFHTCATFAEGAVRCWGDNSHGQLGRPGPFDPLSEYSVDLGSGRKAKGVFAGAYHTCAILEDDGSKCWGDNSHGQLGLEDSLNRGDGFSAMGDTLPHVLLGTEQAAVSVAPGDTATCALVENGRVKCWGDAYQGALGYGDTNPRGATPGTMGDALPAVNLGSRDGRPLAVKTLAAIDYHSFCAVLEDAGSDNSALKCWGSNDYCELGLGIHEGGQGGDPETTGDGLPFVDLGTTAAGAPRKAVSLAGGYQFICVLTDDGRVKCWGDNLGGQLGIGAAGGPRSCEPEDVGDTGFVALSAKAVAVAARGKSDGGGAHACALLETGDVTCWGENGFGQLGTGDTLPLAAPSPALVFEDGFSPARLVLGDRHSCAISTDDRVKCWGSNQMGQLGASVSGDQLAPGPDMKWFGRATVALAAGYDHTCAVLEGGALKCWGRNSEGQLGLGDSIDRGAEPGQLGDALPPVNLGAGAIVRAVAAGAHHSCAVTDEGEVLCWGGNAAGELGQGDTEARLAPPTVPVTLGERASAVAAGASFSCALLASGKTTCWGSNDAGELGTGDAMGRLTPSAPLALAAEAVAITAGDAHACALLDDGRIACWGSNTHGQLGTGDFENRAEPALVELGGATTRAVSARSNQTCALLGAGEVKCWGEGTRGQLGLGDAMDRQVAAADAIDLGAGRSASAIAVGGAFACALLDLAQAKCWGENKSSELGISLLGPAYGDEPGETGDFLPTAFQGGGRAVQAVSAGRAHACAILDTGGVRCWGDNAFGQLGAGDRAVHSLVSSPTANVDLGAS